MSSAVIGSGAHMAMVCSDWLWCTCDYGGYTHRQTEISCFYREMSIQCECGGGLQKWLLPTFCPGDWAVTYSIFASETL